MEWLFLIHLFHLGNSFRDSSLFCFYTYIRILTSAKQYGEIDYIAGGGGGNPVNIFPLKNEFM